MLEQELEPFVNHEGDAATKGVGPITTRVAEDFTSGGPIHLPHFHLRRDQEIDELLMEGEVTGANEGERDQEEKATGS